MSENYYSSAVGRRLRPLLSRETAIAIAMSVLSNGGDDLVLGRAALVQEWETLRLNGILSGGPPRWALAEAQLELRKQAEGGE